MGNTRFSRRLILLAALTVLSFTAPAPVSASTPATSPGATPVDHAQTSSKLFAKHRRWPAPVIRYHVEYRQIAGLVRRAARIWNRSGARVRWREVPARRAHVEIRHVEMTFLLGWAGQLYRPGTRVKYRPGETGGSIVKVDSEVLELWRTKSRSGIPTEEGYRAVQVMAHEMGHIMGLAHTNGCAVMNQRLKVDCPAPPAPDLYRCWPLEPDDVRGAVRLFGGRARIPSGDPWCRIYVPPPPAPIEELQVSYDPQNPLAQGPALNLSWRMPLRNLPARIGFAYGPAGSCPEKPSGAKWFATGRYEPGQEIDLVSSSELSPGAWCVAAFGANEKGILSPEVVTASFTIPE